MPRIRPFHDSTRLSAAGIGVAQPLVGSRNVNRWFSRDTFADHASGPDEALAPVGDGAVRVRALPVKERVACLPPPAAGGGPCGRGVRVRHTAQGDGDLPQLLACPGPWLDPGELGDVHAHAEQAPPHLGIRPALAQRLRKDNICPEYSNEYPRCWWRCWSWSWSCHPRCRTSRHPYTAENPPAWMSMTSRASASWRARMRLTGPGLNMR